MDILIELIKGIAFVLLSVVETAMLARAIVSLFDMEGGKLLGFLYSLTEPFITPVRTILVKMNWLQDSPIDFSFMITFMLISIITLFLS